MKHFEVVSFAMQILEMQRTIDELKAEVASLGPYKEKYQKLLAESLNSNKEIVTGLLQIALTPGIAEAIAEEKKRSLRLDNSPLG